MSFFARLPSHALAAIAVAIGSAAACAEAPLTPEDRDHWAYRPVQRPEPPSVEAAAWPRGAIDRFVLRRLEERGLAPAAEADRPTLLRRLSFDLVGLPPTPAELAEFENDRSPQAYERQVERLLASPGYGERWAQHWLDLARFAETDGFEHDKLRPDAWKYRDWVIAALNSDLPYDQFVLRQLAGDELGEPGGEVATMFCLAGPDMPDLNDQHERRHRRLNELTATVGATLLGLQLGCAECHDHKYDPISQEDFYRLRAVFESALPELKRDQPVSVLAAQARPVAARMWQRGDARRPGPELLPGFPRVATLGAPPVVGPHPRQELARWLFDPSHPLAARVMVNRVWQHHFGRGLFDTPSDAGAMGSEPTHPALLDYLAVRLREEGWRLKALHREIVLSASYRQAGRAAAGQTSWAERLRLDPDGELYSRFPRRRLEGEPLRDAMLAAAGLLSAERGGPGVMPPLPEELVQSLIKGQWTASQRQADHYRRSIYLFARRNLRYPLLEAFDRPEATAACPRRERSTTAPQALLQLNSEFSLLVARRLAGRLLAHSADPQEQIRWLYRLTLARQPTEAETQRIASFVSAQRERLAIEARPPQQLALPWGGAALPDPYRGAALVDACLAMVNASEFLYVD